ncbi:Hypothetical Protein FCC1311_004672 [Hondaea fermentalgiana]|uniref:Uncharacterized protein n=1 Tax=Hondaea fermentalgiana TaxID=2315210 RepID=A0A2R5G1R3_9STRA|nr:Hypothetical Protein FCC1311_004672 [Hondaea fermentalgiana]|eukprot:GBG24249.1 Hypothetical Protein FCC1311_004672 [Hondaea fermentalgiana]
MSSSDLILGTAESLRAPNAKQSLTTCLDVLVKAFQLERADMLLKHGSAISEEMLAVHAESEKTRLLMIAGQLSNCGFYGSAHLDQASNTQLECVGVPQNIIKRIREVLAKRKVGLPVMPNPFHEHVRRIALQSHRLSSNKIRLKAKAAARNKANANNNNNNNNNNNTAKKRKNNRKRPHGSVGSPSNDEEDPSPFKKWVSTQAQRRGLDARRYGSRPEFAIKDEALKTVPSQSSPTLTPFGNGAHMMFTPEQLRAIASMQAQQHHHQQQQQHQQLQQQIQQQLLQQLQRHQQQLQMQQQQQEQQSQPDISIQQLEQLRKRLQEQQQLLQQQQQQSPSNLQKTGSTPDSTAFLQSLAASTMQQQAKRQKSEQPMNPTEILAKTLEASKGGNQKQSAEALAALASAALFLRCY